jgi:hypothetical protein
MNPSLRRLLKATLLTGVALSILSPAQADLIDPPFKNHASVLGGTKATYTWTGFSDETRPSGVSTFAFPTSSGKASQWAGGIAASNNSNVVFKPTNGTDDTNFLTTADGGGIYSFFTATQYAVQSTDALAGIQTLTLQIFTSKAAGGDVVGSALTLYTTTGNVSFDLLTDTSYTYRSDVITVPGFGGADTEAFLLGYQFDLSNYGNVTGYSFDWQVAKHVVIYGIEVAESTAFTSGDILPIPEPSTWSLIAAAGVVGMIVLRRKRVTQTA